MWAKQGVEYIKHKVIPFFESCPAEDATLILTPVHFESPLHWGLLCFDVRTKTVYFDDGLKIQPPSGTLPVVQNMLGGFKALSNIAIEQEDTLEQLLLKTSLATNQNANPDTKWHWCW